MIGKPEWFSPRKFGWGLGVRKIEGIAYIAAVILIVGAIWYSPLEEGLKPILSTLILALFTIDMLDIMRKVYSKLDEREQRHQLIAERNAGFVAVLGLIAYGLYLGFTLPPTEIESRLFPLMGIALAMAIAKGASLLYLEREK